MAEVVITDNGGKSPTNGAQAALNVGSQTPVTSDGVEGVGVHVDNAALSAALSEEAVPGFLHTPYDNAVTICGYPDLVLNQMLRSMGYRQVMSPKFDHFSVDQRKSIDVVTTGGHVDLPSGRNVFKGTTAGGSSVNNTIELVVANVGIFHENDQVMFKGVAGYDKQGMAHPYYYLNGYVSKVIRSSSKIEVVLLNATANTSFYATAATLPAGLTKAGSPAVFTITIANDTAVVILGHALPEEDAHTVPSQSIPEPSEQYMQKFMTQANVTNVWLDSEKNVNWGLKDIKDGVNREFLLETEKTYWFGTKQYFLDPETNKMVRTTGGFFEQLFEEGVEVIEMWKEELTDESLINTMATIFVGNRGSERRYMLTGINFASSIFSLKGMQKQVSVNSTRRQFTYDWNEWKLFNFTIQNKPYSLFDMLGFSNMAVVFDKANIERCVFRPMNEDMLDLDKLMIEDVKVLRCCEISSIVVKQAKSHRIIVMHVGNSQAYDADTNPTGNPDGSLDGDFADGYAA